MVFLIKSEAVSEEIDSDIDTAINRMCEILKEDPNYPLQLLGDEGTVYASAFAGHPTMWAGDAFEHAGRQLGVACVRYEENLKFCPKCSKQIPSKKLACPDCAIAASPKAEPRKRVKMDPNLTERLF